MRSYPDTFIGDKDDATMLDCCVLTTKKSLTAESRSSDNISCLANILRLLEVTINGVLR